MKTRILLFGALVLSLGLASCSGGEQDETNEESQEEMCLLMYDETSTELEFTSFKTNAKVPVKGTFSMFTVNGNEAEKAEDVIKSLEFTINTTSVETNDSGRNAKIALHFFGTLETPEITGKVTALDLDAGKATVMIEMHGISYDVEGTCSLENNKFTYDASIDVINWNAMSGIEALNEQCKDLHTGEDGVSKLWSQVDLHFATTLKSDCK